MLKKIFALWAFAVVLHFAPQAAYAWSHHGTLATIAPPVPTLAVIVPGTDLALIPRSQTPVDPSMSQDGPRCLDSTWGACDVTQHCIAPTSGTPLESCQAPLQITTGTGTGNGTTATIHYVSQTNFTYAAAQPLMISGATQTNWNTPDVHLSSHWVEANTDALCPSSGPSMEVGFNGAPLAAAPFSIGQVVYFSGLSPAAGTGLGWGQNVIGAPQPNARHTLVAVNASTAKFCMTLMPLTTPTITTAGTATTIPTTTTFTNVAFTTTSGTGSGALATIIASNSGVSTITVTNWGNAQYKPGDLVSIATGVGNLTGFVGTMATVSTLGINNDGYAGRANAPWVVSTSACTLTNCTVTFANPYTCASSCISPTTRIVAGQFSDDIVAWHFGENVPMKTFVSGQNVVICALADSVSPQQYVAFEADGGAFVKVTTPIDDPWGAGGPWTINGVGTFTQPFGAAKRVYCAQAAASTFTGDGEHEIRAIAVPIAGYPTQLTSVQAIDGSAASPYFTAHSHGKKDWSYQGITKSFDANFPNYNWNATNASYAFTDGVPVPLTSLSNGTSMTVTWSQNTSSVVPPIAGFKVNQYVGLTQLTATNNSCTVTGGTAALPFVTLNLSGTCNFPTGSTINVAGVANSGSTWDGSNIIVTTGSGACTTTCTVTYPALSSGAYISGGTVTATLNGLCHITSATTNTFTCPNLASSGTTGAQASGCPVATFNCVTNTGNTMCVVGGNADNPAPYTQFDTTINPLNSEMTPDTFQILPRHANVQTCSSIQNATGCQLDLITHTTPCGIVPSQTETLWSWDKDSGRAQGDGGTATPMVGSYFFFTNAGSAIQSSRVYVDAWSPTSVTTGLCRNTSTFAAGSSISDAPSIWSGATCQNISLALFGLGPQVNTTVQTVAQLTGAAQCTVFESTTNVAATPFYVGEPVNFIAGLDTNSGTDTSTGLAMPEFSTFGQYWIVGVGTSQTGNVNGVTLALRPGGPCINEPTTLIVNNTTPGTARLGPDASFDEILFRCNTTLTNPCSASHPETYQLHPTIAAGSATLAAQAGWLNLDPDLAFGTTSTQVSMMQGGSALLTGFSELAARVRSSISRIDKLISFTPVNTVGPTPPQVAATAGSLATCAAPNAAHQCETLTYAAVVDNLNQPNGAKFQNPNVGTGFPGQPIWVAGFANTQANCGTSTVTPCLGGAGGIAGIISSDATHVVFINDAVTTQVYRTSVTTVGSTGTAGTYTGVPLTGGTGSGATGTVVVSASTHLITSLTVTAFGSGYTIGDVLSALSANIGGVTGFAATVAVDLGGTVTGVQLIFEAPPNTFAAACTTSGQVPINTTGSAYCMMNDQTTGTPIGTNQYSLPVFTQPYGSGGVVSNTLQITNNYNCLSTVVGVNTAGTILNKIIPAAVGGTTNDLVYIQTQIGPHNTTGATRALNQCVGDTTLANDGFVWPQGGFTELWRDSQIQTGPLWYAPRATDAITTGPAYATNVMGYQFSDAWDDITYSWGNQAIYALGCINSAETVVSDYCVSGSDRVPKANDGYANPDGTTWDWVTKGWAADGTVTTCGGVNCLTDAAHSDTGKATVSFGVPVGSIPPMFAVNFEVAINCNMQGFSQLGASQPLFPGGVGFASGFNNAATATAPSNATVSATGISGSCVIPTGTPGPGWPAFASNDGGHIDYSFWHYNGDALLPTQVVDSAAGWMHWKDFLERNVTALLGTNEEYTAQGANYYNMAVDDVSVQFLSAIQPGNIATISSVQLAGGGIVTNFIFNNAAFFTVGRISPVPGTQVMTDFYFINTTGGWNTRWPNSSQDAFSVGFEFGSQASIQSYSGASVQGGSWTENAAITPSAARYVDPATGFPAGPAQDPMYNSFLAEPWYGPGSITGDSGLGSW